MSAEVSAASESSPPKNDDSKPTTPVVVDADRRQSVKGKLLDLAKAKAATESAPSAGALGKAPNAVPGKQNPTAPPSSASKRGGSFIDVVKQAAAASSLKPSSSDVTKPTASAPGKKGVVNPPPASAGGKQASAPPAAAPGKPTSAPPPVTHPPIVAEALRSGQWKEMKDRRSNKVYFMNTRTYRTVWDLEQELTQEKLNQPEDDRIVRALKSGDWIEQRDATLNRSFYINRRTRKATWDLLKELGGDREDDDPRSPNAERSNAGMSAIVQDVVFTSHEHYVYVIGGVQDGKESCNLYTLGTQSWELAPITLPLPLSAHSVTEMDFGETVIVCGGISHRTPNNVFWRWSLGNESFVKATEMPTSRYNAGACHIRGNVCLVGGYDSLMQPTPSTYIWNAFMNQWQELAPMYTPRAGHALLSHDVTITDPSWYLFAIGGFDGREKLVSMERYDVRRNVWEFMPPMHEPRSTHSAVILKTSIYALGGRVGYGFSNTVERFDFKRFQWRYEAPMTRQRSVFGTTVCHECIIVAGGWDGIQWLNDAEYFSIATGLWRPLPNLPSPMHGIALCTLKKPSTNRPLLYSTYLQDSQAESCEGPNTTTNAPPPTPLEMAEGEEASPPASPPVGSPRDELPPSSMNDRKGSMLRSPDPTTATATSEGSMSPPASPPPGSPPASSPRVPPPAAARPKVAAITKAGSTVSQAFPKTTQGKLEKGSETPSSRKEKA